MFEITALTPDRHEETAQLFHAVWHETHARLQPPEVARHRDIGFFRNRINQRAERTTVALLDGKVAGFACWTGATLNSLFVAPGQRNLAIGARLCAEMERQMRAAGAVTFELHCIEGNHAGRRFYERHGWRVSRCESKQNHVAGGSVPVATWIMVKDAGA